MRIATNVSALNSWRNLTITNSALSKTLEKLSSGYRINRAADDAAGLAISEKMRGQTAGLNMAVKNAQDGISLIQTGEGALNEVHSMLKRMEELAVQAANDTNTAEDRAKLQSEMDQLAQEISRIGGTTEFNTLKLLDGTFSAKDIVFHIGANEDQNLRIRINDMRSFKLGLAGDVVAPAAVPVAGTYTAVDDLADGTYDLANTGGTNWELRDQTTGAVLATSTDAINFTLASGNDTLVIGAALTDATSLTKAGVNITTDDTAPGANAGTYTPVSDFADGTYTVVQSGSTYELRDASDAVVATSSDGVTYTASVGRDTIAFASAVTEGTVTVAGATITGANDLTVKNLGLEAGIYTVDTDGSTYWNLLDQNQQAIATSADGMNWGVFTSTVALANGQEVRVGGIGISADQAAANNALPTIRAALEKVSSQRSLFGATQNRLDHTISNLQVAAENLSAAESRIRDVDMAAEMASFTKHQILLQTGTAMLAQANTAPQTVLQLLR